MLAVVCVNAPGCGTVAGFTVIVAELAVLVPQPLVAVTDKVPPVAVAFKSKVMALPVPLIVPPVPV